MTEAFPPFDPPYITFFGEGDDIYCIETLLDGTTRPIATPPKATTESINNLDTCKAGKKSGSQVQSTSVSKYSEGQAALYLHVPFAEKDRAKNLGAKWDAKKKKWYVPHGLDLNSFTCWWPEDMK